MKIDHIAIAVNNVEESAKVYQEALVKQLNPKESR
jgi:catechol 2,3-dioxygenase-like lactoylglutathione lyase family enzyme